LYFVALLVEVDRDRRRRVRRDRRDHLALAKLRILEDDLADAEPDDDVGERGLAGLLAVSLLSAVLASTGTVALVESGLGAATGSPTATTNALTTGTNSSPAPVALTARRIARSACTASPVLRQTPVTSST